MTKITTHHDDLHRSPQQQQREFRGDVWRDRAKLVASNILFLVTGVIFWHKKEYFPAVLFWAATIASMMYHGANQNQWRWLDWFFGSSSAFVTLLYVFSSDISVWNSFAITFAVFAFVAFYNLPKTAREDWDTLDTIYNTEEGSCDHVMWHVFGGLSGVCASVALEGR